MKINDNMFFAIEEAKKAYKNDEVPVGAVIVKGNEILVKVHNLVERNKDPLAHAEIIAISQASKVLGNKFLENCDIYVTLEPCPMCAMALSFARIARIYFGAYDIKSGGVFNGPKIFQSKSCHYVPEVYGGIQEKECAKLLTDFFACKREK